MWPAPTEAVAVASTETMHWSPRILYVAVSATGLLALSLVATVGWYVLYIDPEPCPPTNCVMPSNITDGVPLKPYCEKRVSPNPVRQGEVR